MAPIASTTHVTGRKLDFVIIGALVLVLGYFVVDKFLFRHDAAPTTAAAVVETSIAVLPFANMSGDKEQEYFSDGISEELLNQLAKIPNLRVIARTSSFSFSFKGKEVDVATIAKTLGVAHVLEGSIRKSGNTVRITAQLIRTADSSQVWSETYDREMTDIFNVQDEISAAVVAQMKIKLLGAAPTAKVLSPHAYELVLQARALSRQRSAEAFIQAITLLQQALAIAPDNAAAWTLLARIYDLQASDGLRPIPEGVRLARLALNKAISVDPKYALAYAYLGRFAANYDGDLVEAARQISRALALVPDEAEALNEAASLTQVLGRMPAAIALHERLVERDPANAALQAGLGLVYYYSGRWDEAIARYRQALAFSPAAVYYHSQIAISLLYKGQAQAALAENQREAEGLWRAIGLPTLWHALGDRPKSDATLAELVQKYEKDAAYNIAYVYASRGEADKAFEWLDKAVSFQDPGLVDIVVEPSFANIRQDPRWLPFLRKLGKAPEQLDAIVFDVKL